jgi:hypothetical protein
MQNKIRKILLVFSIVAFLFSCLLFFLFYKKIINNINIAKQSQIDFEKETSRREDIKDFNKSFKSIEQEKNLFETHFAQSSDIVPFLNEIEKMAETVGTKVEVSFIEVAKDNTGLIIEMKDNGSFSQVYKFLMLLENSPYELEFSSVDIHSVVKENFVGGKNITKREGWEAFIIIKLISFM